MTNDMNREYLKRKWRKVNSQEQSKLKYLKKNLGQSYAIMWKNLSIKEDNKS